MRIQSGHPLSGTVEVSPDKSVSHRALMFAAMAEGDSRVENVLLSDDTVATIDCLSRLGTEFSVSEKSVYVQPKPFHGCEEELYTANSGTTTRLLAGLIAGYPVEATLAGDASLNGRPMNRVIEPLVQMGADIQSNAGFCPLSIRGGNLHGIRYRMPVASAQVKSAVLLAGIHASGETVIEEPVPSRDHTERMLRAFGADIRREGTAIVVTDRGTLRGRNFRVPGDISTAAFFLVAALITPGSKVVLRNVGLNPTRTGILDALRAMGGRIAVQNLREEDAGEPVGDLVAETSILRGTSVGGDLIPRMIDEIPIFAVAAAFAEGETVISDAQECKVKESDRLTTVATELERAGVSVKQNDDGLVISGGFVKGADFESYGDHRIAMALAVLALAAEGESTLSGSECVSVSCPEFWDLLGKIGGHFDSEKNPDGSIPCAIYTF